MSRRVISKLALILVMLIMITATIEQAVAVTWSENIVRVTEELIFDGLPTITQTNNGSVWIVWTKAVYGDNTIFYKTSSNLGATWSQEKNLTDIPSEMLGRHDTHPSIIQAKNGTIWLVWASNKPSPVPPPPPPPPDFSIDASPKNLTVQQGGSNSSTIIITSLYSFNESVDLFAKNVPLDVTTALNPSRVTPPTNGTVNSTLTISAETTAIPGNYTISVTGKSGLLNHRVEIRLRVINQTGLASFKESSLASLASSSAESDDSDYEIFYKTSNDNGAIWSSRHQLTNNTIDDLSPSIIQLKNDTIMVVRQSDRAGKADISYNATSDGTSWTCGDITTDPEFDQGPSIMQAKDGKIWVVWSSNRTGDDEIFYKTYDGIAWSSENNLTNNPDIDISPSILQTIDGTIMIFWSSRTNSPTAAADIYCITSSDNGVNWSSSVQFTQDQYENTWPALAQTHDTKIWVVWASDRANQPDGNWDIYYQTSLAGDANGDGVVDVYDLSLVGNAYGSFVGEADYNPDADFNKDGCVDMRDLVLVCRNWGAT